MLGLRGLAVSIACLAAIALGRVAVADDPAASAWAEAENAAVRLVSASETAGAGEAVSLGLEFRLADGWKIYWRSPGDAGYPPSIDWAGSDNLESAEIAWPAPQRFSVLGMETLGYEKSAVLPIEARLSNPGDNLRLRANVDYLACSELCVPHSAQLTLDLPAGQAVASRFAHLIDRHQSVVPIVGELPGFDIRSARVETLGDEVRLHVAATADPPFAAPDLFVEGPDFIAFGAPEVELSDGGRRAAFAVPVFDADLADGPLVGERLTLTMVDGARGIERQTEAEPFTTTLDTGPEAAQSFVLILLLGVLGGLILNLMPCVLPVLSIKLLGVVSHGGSAPARVRLGFLASSAGILTSFLILAGAVASLKAAGAAVGWGLQFQQPWFLVTMVLIVALFTANLWDLFEFRLPTAVADAGAAVGHMRGLGGHFLTGVLATLLATPCSAPFLGTAIGFALSRGTAEIFAVFIAVGLGLALPYLAVAAFPVLATRLPKPGRWMIILRRVLGLALAGTAVWLLAVLASSIGIESAALVGLLALAAVVLVAAVVRAHGTRRRVAAAGAAIAALLAFTMPEGSPERAAGLPGLWVPLEQTTIRDHVAEGRVVFVNVTADWCLTCKVNESFVLARGDVRTRLAEPDVVAMQGDWTQPDEGIARYLASFGRYGIPFDAVYGPGSPAGEALPELLTPESVLAAIRRASAASE